MPEARPERTNNVFLPPLAASSRSSLSRPACPSRCPAPKVSPPPLISLRALTDIPHGADGYPSAQPKTLRSCARAYPPYLSAISKATETREKKKAYLCLKQLKGVLAVDLRRLPLC